MRISDWSSDVCSSDLLKLSEAMRGYWASFARSALPKAAGQPDWTAFAPAKAYMYFAGAPRVAPGLLPGHYELHEQVMGRRQVAGKRNALGKGKSGVVR